MTHETRAEMFYKAGDAFFDVSDEVLEYVNDADFIREDRRLRETYDRNGGAFYLAAHRFVTPRY